jgi:hypothetical protein
MRFLWTGYLSARHDFWPRPLSVGTHPTVTTCKANTGKTPRFLRFTEPGDKCGVGQLAMPGRPAGRDKLRPVAASPGGSGRLRDPRLPDLCFGILYGIRRPARRDLQTCASSLSTVVRDADTLLPCSPRSCCLFVRESSFPEPIHTLMLAIGSICDCQYGPNQPSRAKTQANSSLMEAAMCGAIRRVL